MILAGDEYQVMMDKEQKEQSQYRFHVKEESETDKDINDDDLGVAGPSNDPRYTSTARQVF